MTSSQAHSSNSTRVVSGPNPFISTLSCRSCAIALAQLLKPILQELAIRLARYHWQGVSKIFEAAPSDFIDSPKDAAEIAYAMMIGLRSAVYFDANIELADAHRLFLSSTLAMCGFNAPAAASA